MERPILFSTEMVKAILDGRKTQTRRVIKAPNNAYLNRFENGLVYFNDAVSAFVGIPCKYGIEKDVLWVRETWKAEELPDDTIEYQPGLDGIRYKADGFFRPIENTREASELWMEASRTGNKWRPSIFMPRWASRITLEILNIRVERVQEISDLDCWAEGLPQELFDEAEHFQIGGSELRGGSPERCAFAQLWDSINAKRGYSWEANPWVWVIVFKALREKLGIRS